MVAPNTPRHLPEPPPFVVEPLVVERHLREYRLADGVAIVALEIEDATDEYQHAFAERVYECLAGQRGPFAVIVDVRRLTRYPASQRQAYADVRERLREHYRRYHRQTVYVADTAAQRGFLTAVSWMAKASPTSGREFTDDWQYAYDRCRAALVDGASG